MRRINQTTARAAIFAYFSVLKQFCLANVLERVVAMPGRKLAECPSIALSLILSV